jgi:enediyne biosynthesis protein E4
MKIYHTSSIGVGKKIVSLSVALMAFIGWQQLPEECNDTQKTKTLTVHDVDKELNANLEHFPTSDIFLDVTKQCGIDFVHFNGTTGEYLLPEITGTGGALFDYDNDGDMDLYAVQGAELKTTNNPKAVPWRGKSPPGDRLFRNDLNSAGIVRFTDVTKESGIKAFGYGMGAATGDYNNDGWIDLYVTNLGSNQLWRNNGNGTFTDVTKATKSDDSRWSTSATFLDYDKDGRLDLFMTNYVDFSISMDRECFTRSSALDYCGPEAYDPIGDKLFHNLGNGTFKDVTISSGISKAFGAGLGAIAADFDGDGWVDLFVANDGDFNQLWKNKQGSGEFEDIALMGGVAVNNRGQAEASMGVTAADFDGDGDEDLFMTHLNQESNTFYVNQGNGLFDDRTARLGLHVPSLRYTSFGTSFFDYDNDGWLDLLVLSGEVRIIEELAKKRDPYPLHQPNQLYHNNGKSNYIEVSQNAGSAFGVSEVSRGAALGDIDNDGDTDIAIFNNNGPARVLLNQVGKRSHWLGFRLLQKDNTDSFQARIEVLSDDGKALWRRVHTDGSYCSASDPRVLIGLGDNAGRKNAKGNWQKIRYS